MVQKLSVKQIGPASLEVNLEDIQPELVAEPQGREAYKETQAVVAKPQKAKPTLTERAERAQARADKAKQAVKDAEARQAAAQEATACKSLLGSINLIIGKWESKKLSDLLMSM